MLTGCFIQYSEDSIEYFKVGNEQIFTKELLDKIGKQSMWLYPNSVTLIFDSKPAITEKYDIMIYFGFKFYL